jgi:hypothetical protein
VIRAVVLAAVLLVARGARAAPAPNAPDAKAAEAAELYEEGKRHFDLAEYGPAIASWKHAYLLSSEPLLLFNIAQAYRLSGDCAEANRFYLTYQRSEPNPSKQADLTQAMAKCAGVEPASGDRSEPATPPSVPAPPPPPPPETGDRGRNLRLTGYAVGGLGGLAVIIGVASAVSASSHASTVQSQQNGTTWGAGLQQEQSDGQSAATRARILIGVGAAALVGGGVLWWLGRAPSSVKVDVSIAPDRSQVSVSCAF